MKICIVLIAIAPLSAQWDLRPQAFGCHAGPTGQLRLFEGVRASVVGSLLIAEGVRSGMCAAGLALYQSGSQVVLRSGGESYPLDVAGAILLAVDEGLAAAVDPATGAIDYWNGGAWLRSVIRIGPDAKAVRLVQRKLLVLTLDQIITIDIVNGSIERAVAAPAIGAAVALLGDGSILTIVANGWMRCHEAGCSELGSAPEGVVSLAPLNRDWLAASSSAGTVFAVRVAEGSVDRFILPGDER